MGTALAVAGDTVAIPWHEVVVSGLLSVCFAILWKRDRGAWLAWGAHLAWLWTIGPLTHGGLLDVRWASGTWGGGDVNASNAGAVALAAVLLGALAWYHRRR